MTVWYTADLHFGHANIIKYCNRPFRDVDHMNQELIRRWNECVAPEDMVFVLGDVALGKLAETLPLVQQLSGSKILVPGNHDRCWPGHKKVRPSDIDKYRDAGFSIGPSEWHMEAWTLCHFPYEEDPRHQDKYAGFHPVDRGRWLLHGHVHDLWRVKRRQINVGVDVWNFYPVSNHQIEELIRKERGVDG
jgi:calcineurin-like phosphoesterase family protein